MTLRPRFASAEGRWFVRGNGMPKKIAAAVVPHKCAAREGRGGAQSVGGRRFKAAASASGRQQWRAICRSCQVGRLTDMVAVKIVAFKEAVRAPSHFIRHAP